MCATTRYVGDMKKRAKREPQRTKAEREADARRTGRPPLGDAAKTEIVRIRVTKKELAELKKRAAAQELGIAAFLRIAGGLKA